MRDNIEIVTEFVSSWKTLDAGLLADFFTDDGTYHNIPAKPVVGKDNIKQFISAFIASWTETEWDILTIAAQGDTVLCERLDRTKTKNGDVDLPCLGVFEMQDGKIHVWRDYFDMATFLNAMKRSS